MAGCGTGLGSSTARVNLGERLLSGAFRGCCFVMRAAARFCELGNAGEATGHENRAVDFHALALLNYAPLGEIVAAQRELCAWESAGIGARDAPVETRIVRQVSEATRRVRLASGLQRSQRSTRLSRGRA